MNIFFKKIIFFWLIAMSNLSLDQCEAATTRPKVRGSSKNDKNYPPLVIQPWVLPVGKVGVAYNANHQHFVATGGDEKYLFGLKVVGGDLPPGLRLDAETARGNFPYVAGTPLKNGFCMLRARVIDESGHKAERIFSLQVGKPDPLRYVSNTLPGGTVGSAYSADIQVSGGVGEYSWCVVDGELPDGVNLDGNGHLSGVPTNLAAGIKPFVVSVEDESGQIQTRRFQLTTQDSDVDVRYAFDPFAYEMRDVSASSSLLSSTPAASYLAVQSPVEVQSKAFCFVPVDTAEKILRNMLDKDRTYQHGFKPGEGKNGGASFFTSEGRPYVGRHVDTKGVRIAVKIIHPSNIRSINTYGLFEIYDEIWNDPEVSSIAKKEYDEGKKNGTIKKKWSEHYKGVCTSKTWDRVGVIANNEPSKVLEVVLDRTDKEEITVNGKLVKRDHGLWSGRTSPHGKFLVCADTNRIRIVGGISRMMALGRRYGFWKAYIDQGQQVGELSKKGEIAVKAAQRAAGVRAGRGYMRQMGQFTSRRRTGMIRPGALLGLVFVVWQLKNDAIEIYHAEDRVDAIVTKVGGWAGAAAGVGIFSMIWAPADIAGPVAWVAHGVGGLVAGGIGYFVGSSITHNIYKMSIMYASGEIPILTEATYAANMELSPRRRPYL